MTLHKHTGYTGATNNAKQHCSRSVQLVKDAKLAKTDGRFGDMTAHMKTLSQTKKFLTEEERELFWSAYIWTFVFRPSDCGGHRGPKLGPT